MRKNEIRREEQPRRRRLGLLDTQRTPSRWSIPQHGETTTEPLFGADALQHRHTGRLPGSGLGLALCQQTVSAGGDFNECEMAVLRAAASGTRGSRSASGPKFEVSMHGQWKGLRGKGGAICHGAFVYPLFGNSSYEGSLVNGQRHGQGRQESHSGVYVGEFKEGDMSGSGRRIYCDGGCYEGEWLAGLKHGRGVFVLANGDAYNGEFRAGVMEGQGVYRFASGDVYRGSMCHDAMHGQGEYQYAATTKARYKGTFADNRRHGKGTFEFQEDGLTYSYAGEFVQDQQTGRAFLSISNGDTYAGTFLAGKYHGRGIYSFKDGSRYEGDFCAGMMHGQGKFVGAVCPKELHAAGECFEGLWRNGLRHGSGLVSLTDVVTGDTETIRGTWSNGVREGDFVRTTCWGRVVSETCSQGTRTGFSLGQESERLGLFSKKLI